MFSLDLEDKSDNNLSVIENKFSLQVQTAVDEVGKALLGKDQQIRLALCCLLSGGHLLIEDLPGMGKTTLSYALAKTLGLVYNRIQFTSDLLPADILGISIFDQKMFRKSNYFLKFFHKLCPSKTRFYCKFQLLRRFLWISQAIFRPFGANL